MHLQARKGWHYSDVVNQWDYSDAINQWHYSDIINQWNYFSVFELSRSMLVMHQKKLLIKPRFIRASSRWSVLLWKDYAWFLIELSIFNFFVKFHRSGPAIIFSL